MSNHVSPPPRVAMVLCAVLLVAVVGGIIVTLALGDRLDENSTPLVLSLVGITVTTVPALVGAAYATRASNDLRNGLVVEKTREGAQKAIEEAKPVLVQAVVEGVDEAQVLKRTGPVVTAELAALTELLSTTREVAENTARIAGRRSGDRAIT